MFKKNIKEAREWIKGSFINKSIKKQEEKGFLLEVSKF